MVAGGVESCPPLTRWVTSFPALIPCLLAVIGFGGLFGVIKTTRLSRVVSIVCLLIVILVLTIGAIALELRNVLEVVMVRFNS
jgi:hypothetical protein